MNTGQMMLSIGAMMLLSVLVLRINNNILTTDTVMMGSKFDILAMSLATSLLEEAKSKAYDENSVSDAIAKVSELSTTLGKDPYETYPNFDDFDDYNGYTRTDSSLPSAIYKITCSVVYVNDLSPDVTTTSRTWHKKLTVTVSSQAMEDTIKLSTVFSYWYFR